MILSESVQTIATLNVPADARMLSVCRMVLGGVGRGTAFDDAAVEDLKLVLSEVAGAAILAAPDGSSVGIEYKTSRTELEVIVSSANGSFSLDGGDIDLTWLRELCTELEVISGSGAEFGVRVRFTRSAERH